MPVLETFSSYMKASAENGKNDILNELNERKHYKPKGQHPYSAVLIRYALLLRYTSKQSYLQLLEKFPLPSLSLCLFK